MLRLPNRPDALGFGAAQGKARRTDLHHDGIAKGAPGHHPHRLTAHEAEIAQAGGDGIGGVQVGHLVDDGGNPLANSVRRMDFLLIGIQERFSLYCFTSP
jgi:hypothetical protein